MSANRKLCQQGEPDTQGSFSLSGDAAEFPCQGVYQALIIMHP